MSDYSQMPTSPSHSSIPIPHFSSTPPPPLPTNPPPISSDVPKTSGVETTSTTKSQGLGSLAKERISKVYNDFKTSVSSISPKQSISKFVRFVTTISPPSVRRSQNDALLSSDHLTSSRTSITSRSEPLTSSRTSITSRSSEPLSPTEGSLNVEPRGSTSDFATRYEKEVEEELVSLSRAYPKKTDKEIGQELQKFVQNKLEQEGYTSRTGQNSQQKAASILDKILTTYATAHPTADIQGISLYNAAFVKDATAESLVKKYPDSMKGSTEFKNLEMESNLYKIDVNNYMKLKQQNARVQTEAFTKVQKEIEITFKGTGMAPVIIPNTRSIPLQERLEKKLQEKNILKEEKSKLIEEMTSNADEKNKLSIENEELKKEKTISSYRKDGMTKANAIGQTIIRNKRKMEFYEEENRILKSKTSELDNKLKKNSTETYLAHHHLFISQFNEKDSKISKLNDLVTEFNNQGNIEFNVQANNNPSNIASVRTIYMNDPQDLYKITAINTHYVNEAAEEQIPLSGVVYEKHTENLNEVFNYQFQENVSKKDNLDVLEKGMITAEVLSLLEANHGAIPPELSKNYSPENIESAQDFYESGIKSKDLSDVNERILNNLLAVSPENLKNAIDHSGPKLKTKLLDKLNTPEGLALLEEDPAKLKAVSDAFVTKENLSFLEKSLPSTLCENILKHVIETQSESELKALMETRKINVKTKLVEILLNNHLKPIPNETLLQKQSRNAAFHAHLEGLLESHSNLDVSELIEGYKENRSTENLQKRLKETMPPPPAPTRAAPLRPTRPRAARFPPEA